MKQGDDAITVVKTLAERVTSARTGKGLSQAKLAELAGVSAGTIGNIEAGFRKRPRDLLAIAKALKVTPEWLATGTGPRNLPAEPKTPTSDFSDRREVTESDWALLEAVKVATTDAEKEEILKRHELLLDQARKQLEELKR